MENAPTAPIGQKSNSAIEGPLPAPVPDMAPKRENKERQEGPSGSLMWHIAHGEFEDSSFKPDKITDTVSDKSYQALEAQHDKLRHSISDSRQRQWDKTFPEDGLSDSQIIAKRHGYEMANWARGEALMLENFINSSPNHEEAINALLKLGINPKIGGDNVNNIQDFFYKLSVDGTSGQYGPFYEKYCRRGKETNRLLAKDLTIQDMDTLQPFLEDILGDPTAFLALKALRETQDMLDGTRGNEKQQIDKYTYNSALKSEENSVFNYFREGAKMVGGKAQQSAQPDRPTIDTKPQSEVIPLQQLLQVYSTADATTRNMLLDQFAKNHNTTQEEAFNQLKEFAKQKILGGEKGPLYHYHRTTTEAFSDIVANGALLSRTEMTNEGIADIPDNWSASSEVMMTRDVYRKDGQLAATGLGDEYSQHGPIIFAFNQSVMDAPGYNAINSRIPTASRIPLADYGAAILIDESLYPTHDAFEAAMTNARDTLDKKGLQNIAVESVTDWKVKQYPSKQQDTTSPLEQTSPISSPTPDTVEKTIPLSPDKQKDNIRVAREEIFGKAGKRTAEEHMQLIVDIVDDPSQGIAKEKETGKGKLKKNIQETVSSTEGNKFIRDGAIAYIPPTPGEKVITIGDIHGDLATIQQILDNEKFIENMESGNPTLRVVFLGDMVDRGPKSVEVMEVFMALKKRYGERVQMIAADHDTTQNTVSSHDFPDKLKGHFGKEFGADIYGSYTRLFEELPKMVITGNGDILVHGGFPPIKDADLTKIARLDEDATGIYGEAMSWADPIDVPITQEERQKMSMREVAYAGVLQSVDQSNMGENDYIGLGNLTDHYRAWAQHMGTPEDPTNPFPNISENCSIKVKDLRKALQVLQNLPTGIGLNMARAGSPYTIDAILAGLFTYDESAFNNFMVGIGGKIMIRGHQTSDDVAGGPNTFNGHLQTIHSTGGNSTAGSPDSAYKFRETDPKYAVLELGKQRDKIQFGTDVKDVWKPTAIPATPQIQQPKPSEAPKPIRTSGPVPYSPNVKIINRISTLKHGDFTPTS